MMPVLPKSSQVSGALSALSDAGLRGIASIAITFINLNKYSSYRKNFSFSSGTSGKQTNTVMSLTNKKIKRPLEALLRCK